MTMIRNKIAQLGLKIETTEGTKIALVAADFIPVANPNFTPDVKINPLNKVTGSLSPSAGRPGLRSAKISFDYYLRGASAAGTAPEIGTALKACGLDPTTVASTSVTYNPAPLTITPPSVTIELQRDGKIYRLWGARGNVKLSAKDGEVVVLSFEFTGADFEEVDGVKTAGVTFATLAEPVFMGAALTLGATAMQITGLDLDLGNTVTLRQSVNSASGHLSAMITGRQPVISIDPEEVKVSEFDHVTAWRNGTTAAFATGVIGSVAGNRFAINAPVVQYQGLSQSERGGISALSIKALCCRNAGDDEVSIAFT